MLLIPSPSQWAILAAALFFIAGSLIWGVWGVIATTVPGEGILLRQDSVFDVVALGSGQVAELLVSMDDMVAEGQIIGRIHQLELQNSIADAESRLKALLSEQKILTRLGAESHAKKNHYLEQRRATLQAAIVSAKERLRDVREISQSMKAMKDNGVVSRNEYLKTKHEYDRINKQIMDYTDLLAGLSSENVNIDSLREKESIELQKRVAEARKDLETLRLRLERSSAVISTRSGRVAEVFKGRGEMVGVGEPLVRLEISSDQDDLFMVAYFSPYQGKMIEPGMPIHLTPSTVRPEEFGYILGEVERVSLFPASRKGMLHILGNAALVDRLSLGGAPIMVTVRLLKDPSTVRKKKNPLD